MMEVQPYDEVPS